jgi:2-amino-4-hydroxy-6-hydroxymethyldihydropteridine diphosphokinase
MNRAVTAYIGLGANLGDRRAHIRRAVEALNALEDLTVVEQSELYETDPVGGPPQPRFLNGVVKVECRASPREILRALLEIEAALGRTREGPNRPRPIDLDLLLWDDTVVDEEGLTVPHPCLHERWFVLRPLADIAPHVRHPVLGLTVEELLRKVEADAR